MARDRYDAGVGQGPHARVSRRRALALLGAAGVAAGCERRSPSVDPAPAANTAPLATGRAPVLFVGHGSPMNAIEDNRWSRAQRELGQRLARPRAILCVSAHWYVRGTFVTAQARPRTIHDFGGFPRALHEVEYPARGDGALAGRVAGLLSAARGEAREDWGLDHGAWSVLVRMRPEADVPVLQLSIDRGATLASHVAIGRALRPLRDEGVMILASGNVTHNLRHAFGGGGETPAWARDFDRDLARALEQRDERWLLGALDGDAGKSSHPTPDHFLPVLYAFGASAEGDRLGFPVEGFDMGSLSMRSALFG